MNKSKKYIVHAFDENLTEMREALQMALYEKVFSALEERKQEIAKGLVSPDTSLEDLIFKDIN